MTHGHKHLHGWTAFSWRDPIPASDDFNKTSFTDDTSYHQVQVNSIVPVDTIAIICLLTIKDNTTGSVVRVQDYARLRDIQIANTQVANVTQNLVVWIPIYNRDDRNIYWKTDPKPTDWTTLNLTILGWVQT